MCISVEPVEFGNTITGYHASRDGSHTIFYQNTVGSPKRSSLLLNSGSRSRRSAKSALPAHWQVADDPRGNALVIPLLTRDWDSIELLRGTAETPDLLKNIRTALMPPMSRSKGLRTLSFSAGGGEVVIEQFDIYTIVRAENASAIPDAVKEVESRKRPPLNQELFEALQKWYGCPFAVACFNNDDDNGESKPIAFNFQPLHPEVFMIYTMDGHDGTVPDLNEVVTLDHTIFASSYGMDGGKQVSYSDDVGSLGEHVPHRVVGKSFEKGTRMRNGDILVTVDSVKAGQFEAYRVAPPKAENARPAEKLEEAEVSGRR